MKKILMSAFLICFLLQTGFAQDKKASLGIGFGGAAASAKDLDGIKDSGFGFNFYLNGMYNINANLSAGIEYNGNAVVIAGVDPNGFNLDFKASSINGILAKGRYAFGSGSGRPYVGAMLGVYRITPGSVSISGSGTPLQLAFESKTSFGFAPEVGVMLRSFQLSTSYHLPGKYKAEIPDGSGGTRAVETTYTVWQFNIGWNIGLMDN